VPRGKDELPPSNLHVGRWQVEPSLNCIRNGRIVRRLEPQVVNLLVFLASSNGRVVTKDEIIDGVWQGRFIAETTLTRSIADLRRALGDQTQRPRYIETIPKRGYRLVAPVSGLPRGNEPSSPVSRDAYARYVEGRHHFLKGTAESLERARECLSEAVRLEPAFIAAHDALAELFWYLGFFGHLPPKDACALGVWQSLRALELDEQRPESHAMLGMLRKELDFDWAEVHREFARALELDPRSHVVRARHALCGLLPMGRYAEAAAALEAIVGADPLPIHIRWFLASVYLFSRQQGPTRAHVDRMLQIDDGHPLSHMMLGIWQLVEWQLPAAVGSLEHACRLAGRPAWLLGWLGLAYGMSGRREAARSLFDELQAESAARYVPPFALAMISLGLDDLDAMFEWMNRAIDARDPFVIPLPGYPVLDRIRSDPRYPPLLARLNLCLPGSCAPAAPPR
jgi:DNA-binding winged helix-turn-helix (wHTH) protein/tetratricopeptide (TPR) repeat protein